MLGLKLRVLGLRLSNDKQGISMKAKVLCVSLVVAQGLWAMNVDRYNFYTRDYLDFGQNLGQFTPGAKNLSIVKKNGEVVALPDLPFPDFSKFDGSNRTSVGGAYTASSKHVTTQKKTITLGNTDYGEMEIKQYYDDSAFTRVNKFIIEGGYKATDFRTIKNKLQDYTIQFQGKNRVIMYRSGNGLMNFNSWKASPNNKNNFTSSPGIAGGLLFIEANDIRGGQLKVDAADGRYGPLKGAINTGDSGSPAFIYNNITKEWEFIATGWGGSQAGQNVSNTFWAVVDPKKLDELKKQYEREKVANGGAYSKEDNRDSVYTDSGTIVINDAVDQKGGGIILRGGG